MKISERTVKRLGEIITGDKGCRPTGRINGSKSKWISGFLPTLLLGFHGGRSLRSRACGVNRLHFHFPLDFGKRDTIPSEDCVNCSEKKTGLLYR